MPSFLPKKGYSLECPGSFAPSMMSTCCRHLGRIRFRNLNLISFIAPERKQVIVKQPESHPEIDQKVPQVSWRLYKQEVSAST